MNNNKYVTPNTIYDVRYTSNGKVLVKKQIVRKTWFQRLIDWLNEVV